MLNAGRHRKLYLVALIAAAALFVWRSSAGLPAVVAAHFDASGAVNGYMPRTAYVGLMLVLTIGVPLLLALLPAGFARGDGAGLNLPHREYWLHADRRAATFAQLRRYGERFALLVAGFLIYTHALVVLANQVQPPRLSSAALIAGLAIFLLLTLAWIFALRRHFRLPR